MDAGRSFVTKVKIRFWVHCRLLMPKSTRGLNSSDLPKTLALKYAHFAKITSAFLLRRRASNKLVYFAQDAQTCSARNASCLSTKAIATTRWACDWRKDSTWQCVPMKSAKTLFSWVQDASTWNASAGQSSATIASRSGKENTHVQLKIRRSQG